MRPPGEVRPGLAGVTRHRGVLWLGVISLVMFAGALLLAILAARGNRDAVPGTDTIASLGVIPAGYLVGTTGGLAVSPDARAWSVAHLPSEVVPVASQGAIAYVLAGGVLRSTSNLKTFNTLASGVTGTVIAAGPGGSVDIVDGRRIIQVAGGGGANPAGPRPVQIHQGGPSMPKGIVGVSVDPAHANTILAGGPTSGLWETEDGGATWYRLLGTPTQAVAFDPANPQRILLGTVAGVLISGDGGLSWRFTQLRLDVHGLAAEGGRFYAVSGDRRLFVSPNGVSGWGAAASG
jgi:hypothetical protein